MLIELLGALIQEGLGTFFVEFLIVLTGLESLIRF